MTQNVYRNDNELVEKDTYIIIEIKPFLLNYNSVCTLLDIERNALRNLMKKDDSFPEPLKMGASRQAAVYFDREEIESWYQGFKKRCRGQNEEI